MDTYSFAIEVSIVGWRAQPTNYHMRLRREESWQVMSGLRVGFGKEDTPWTQ